MLIKIIVFHLTVTNPLDSILDTMHKNFMQEYLKKWPCIPKVQYSVGQKLVATCNGTLQACEVLKTDCSIMQVVFEVGLAPAIKHLLTAPHKLNCALCFS